VSRSTSYFGAPQSSGQLQGFSALSQTSLPHGTQMAACWGELEQSPFFSEPQRATQSQQQAAAFAAAGVAPDSGGGFVQSGSAYPAQAAPPLHVCTTSHKPLGGQPSTVKSPHGRSVHAPGPAPVRKQYSGHAAALNVWHGAASLG
jgi:hypothetical protein